MMTLYCGVLKLCGAGQLVKNRNVYLNIWWQYKT
jgi:hypothetical protein